MTDSYTWNPFNGNNSDTNLDIEFIKREVAKRFPFYDMRFNLENIVFFCRINNDTLDKDFEDLRKSLSKKNYIPMLRFQQGEHLIYVIKKPKRKEKPVWVNLALIIATIITTILTGSILSMNYLAFWTIPNPYDIFKIENLLNGALYFSLPLMSILFIHEMGHYYLSKKHGIATSLPFFIPVPPILPVLNIGTFGALISSHDPMSNKKTLFDIGFAGPLAGFIVAIPVIIIGIYMADIVPIIPIDQIPEGEAIFGSSLLIDFFVNLLRDIPQGYTIDMNPVLFAGWVGLLITSLNLLPAGQLDGGHIFRSVLGDKQKYAGWAAIIVMLFTGWWFFAFFILLVIGTNHPPPLNDYSSIDLKRKLLFILALFILIVCFIPFPIYSNI